MTYKTILLLSIQDVKLSIILIFPFTKDYFNDLKIEKNYCNIDQEEGHQITTHVDTFLEGKKLMR